MFRWCTENQKVIDKQEKIVVNHVSDEGLVFKIHKNSYKSIEEKTQDVWFKNG